MKDCPVYTATIAIVTHTIFGKYYGDIIRLESKEDVFGTINFKRLLNGIHQVQYYQRNFIEKVIISEYGDSVKFVGEEGESFSVRGINDIIEVTDGDYNYLYDEVDWLIRYRGEDEYRPISYDPAESDESVDYIEEETKMDGIKTCPIFDTDYFHVGDAVRITTSERIDFSSLGWYNKPCGKFNALILDVLPEKLLIAYYTKNTSKLIGRYAIPINLVLSGDITVYIISRS